MLDKSSSPPSLQQIAGAFRRVGWLSLWIQLVLTVVSSGILIFAGLISRGPATATNSPGTGVGASLTTVGIAILLFSIYWSFRYIQTGRQLAASTQARPKKSDTIQKLRIGLMASLSGMLVALLGAQATVGALAAKAFSQGFGGFVSVDPSRFIQPLDILVVQASVNVILGQFAGIAAALWLLNRLSR